MADFEAFRKLGFEMGNTLSSKPLNEAKSRWTSMLPEDQEQAKQTFYRAAEAAEAQKGAAH